MVMNFQIAWREAKIPRCIDKHHSMKACGGRTPRLLWSRHYIKMSSQFHAMVASHPSPPSPDIHPEVITLWREKSSARTGNRQSTPRFVVVQPIELPRVLPIPVTYTQYPVIAIIELQRWTRAVWVWWTVIKLALQRGHSCIIIQHVDTSWLAAGGS